MKIIIPILFLFLVGCQAAQPPIQPVKIITETVQIEVYQPVLPQQMKLDEVSWYVITEDNLEEKIAEIKKFSGTDFVVFAITPSGYENMAYNFQEMRRFILQQNEIITYYTEVTKPKNQEEWTVLNDAKTRAQMETVDVSNNLRPTIEPIDPSPSFLRRLWPF